jgi:predicted protein tyrosine phosphatase
MFVRTSAADDLRGVITIHCQREYPLDVPVEGVRRLALEFDDTEAPSTSDPIHAAQVRLRQRQAAEVGLRLCPPTVDDAKSIIDFAISMREAGGVLLCHCQAGISRSPAAALICLAAWTGPGHERDCVSYVLKIRPAATPPFGSGSIRRPSARFERSTG